MTRRRSPAGGKETGMKVWHHNDLDGRAAAAVVAKWWRSGMPGTEADGCVSFEELDYKDRAPIGTVKAGELVVIVDFSLTPATMAELLTRTENVIWIDHHATAAGYHYGRALRGVRDFKDKGWSGCELAWAHFFGGEIPEALLLVGDYDSWRMERKPRCLQFHEGMKLRRHGPTDPIWDRLFCTEHIGREVEVRDICRDGAAAMSYQDQYCEEFRGTFGFATMIDGIRAYACNLYRFGSPAFGERMREFPVCIAFAFDGRRWTVSLYSESVDVGAICKKFGGGGHKGAAGFVTETLPFGPEFAVCAAEESQSGSSNRKDGAG